MSYYDPPKNRPTEKATVPNIDMQENPIRIDNQDKPDSPVLRLKEIVKSIDQEIDSRVMLDLTEEIGRLREDYKGDKNITTLLKLLKSVVKYISNRKRQAHPDAIKLLNSVFGSIIKVINSNLTEKEEKDILLVEMNNFRDLKENVAAGRFEDHLGQEMKIPREPVFSNGLRNGLPNRVESPSKVEITVDPLSMEAVKAEAKKIETLDPHEAFAYALNEIRKTIQEEFSALRDELKSWNKT